MKSQTRKTKFSAQPAGQIQKAAHRTGGASSALVSASPRSKRKQIVKAALKVFLAHGYEGTSIAKVADSAHVIKATIYSHFRDKHALFKAIMEDLTVEKGIFEMEVEAKTIEPEAFFDLLANKMIDRNADPQFRALIRVVIGESGRFPELSQLFYQTVSCRGNRLMANFIRNHKELRIADPEAAAQIITGSMVYWMLSQEVMGGKHVEPIASQRIISMLKILFMERRATPTVRRRAATGNRQERS